MSLRSSSWQRTCSDTISWRQDQALNATMYILRQTGPTGFLLKEDGENKKYKVFLGDPHTCTCQDFRKEKQGLCKHICWLILRKFRIPRQNPITWQLGLVDRELHEVLRGAAAYADARRREEQERSRRIVSGEDEEERQEDGKAVIKQRDVGEEDVCPICQEELLAKRLPVTYCKFGCGNNVHIKCMKVWADHQKSQGKTEIECPFCRKDFGPISALKQELRNSGRGDDRAEKFNEHLGVSCNACHTCPIVGKCYRCNQCAAYHLCQKCFNTSVHTSHSFSFRQKSTQRWRPVTNRTVGGNALPAAVVTNLQAREIGDNDYDLLLQLDQNSVAVSELTEESLRMLPTMRVQGGGMLLAPGEQCRVCLRPYARGEQVRRLPCSHKFHKECIDNWLLHRRPTCPVDGTTYTNDSIKAAIEAYRSRFRRMSEENRQDNSNNQRVEQQSALALEIPGISIARVSSAERARQPATQNGFVGDSNRNVRRTNNPRVGIRRPSQLSRGAQERSQNSSTESTQPESNGIGGFYGIFHNQNSEPQQPQQTPSSAIVAPGLTLDAITSEIDTIITHSRASSGNSNPGMNSRFVRPEPSSGDSGLARDLGITGSAGGSNMRAQRTGSSTHQRTTADEGGSNERAIDPSVPSIPLPHNCPSLPTVGSSKPPQAPGVKRAGRVRARQPLHIDATRPRSRDRVLATTSALTGAMTGLFVGQYPSSAPD